MDVTARPAAPDTETLRALGRRLDAQGGRTVRLDVRGADLWLAAWLPAERRGASARLAVEDLAALRAAALGRRGERAPDQSAPSRTALGYQESLRLVGQRLERRGARLVRLIEHSTGLIVQSAPVGAAGGSVATELATWAELAAQHRLAIRQRGSA